MKTSILERFATDVVDAPAAVTGGGGKRGWRCKNHKDKSKSKSKTRSKSHSKSRSRSRSKVLY